MLPNRRNAALDFDNQNFELDLVAELDQIYDPRHKIMRDLKVDDRDLPEAANFFEFCNSGRFIEAPLFSRQMYAMSTLFHEWCPHCSNKKYTAHIRDVPLNMSPEKYASNFVMLQHGVCPKCKRTKLDLFKEGSLNAYQELAGLAGQRVGKSFITAAGCVYLTHKQLKLQNPSKVYGILPTTLVGTFVGLTYAAAYEQLWLPFKNMVDSSPWFQELHHLLDDCGNRSGEEYYKNGQQTLHYLHRNLLAYPSGPNKKTLRGKTRMWSSIDEWDFFNSDEEGEDQVKMNGIEIYKSLNNSLLTVRTGWRECIKRGQFGVPNGYQMNISSPMSARGVLTSTVDRNMGVSKRVYCFHLPTWEVNPKIKRSALIQEYTDDPVKAERDFGANPPVSDNPFLSDPGMVKDLVGKAPNWADIAFITKRSPSGSVRRAAKIAKLRTPAILPPASMAIDAGFSNNSFALSIGHRLPTTKVAARVSTLVEIIPERAGVTLDYSAIYEFIIKPLIKGLNVQHVWADRWQSLKVLHDIEADFEIPAKQYSIKYRDFALVKSYLMDEGSVVLPRSETPANDLLGLLKVDLGQYPMSFKYRPVDHLYLQMCTVRDTNRDVIKADRLTDDLWRATALNLMWLMDTDWCAEYLRVHTTQRRDTPLGVATAGGGLHNTMYNPLEATSNVGSLGGMYMDLSKLYALAAGQ